MKRLLPFVFIALVVAMWSNPVVCSARTLAVVNQTGHPLVVAFNYVVCRSDRLNLAPGQTGHVNAYACLNRSAQVRMANGQSCNKTFVISETRQSNIAIVKNGNACGVITRP